MPEESGRSRINWPATFAEVTLILVGLLMAFAADRAWEGRRDRALEADYLSRLDEDFDSTRVNLARIIQHQGAVLTAGARILQAIADGPPEDLSSVLVANLPVALDWRSPTFVTATYDEMEASGTLGLIRDQELRVALAEFDALLTHVVPIGEGAVLDEWTHRVRPFLGPNLSSDIYMTPDHRSRLSVPDAPFETDYGGVADDPEFWNLLTHRLIIEEHRLTDHHNALALIGRLLDLTP
ncbi:MAG: hypothetical protein ACR2QM_06990 [Longimicrobiales bacterium]